MGVCWLSLRSTLSGSGHIFSNNHDPLLDAVNNLGEFFDVVYL